jgi:uncharacterized membrane protein
MTMKMMCVFLLTISLWLLQGCGKVTTSSSSDALIYGAGIDGGPNFLAARVVMSQKCFQCHDWVTYSESDYASQALVTRNSAVNSRLYKKIKGNDSGITGNMPPSGLLTDSDLIKIKVWIDSM